MILQRFKILISLLLCIIPYLNYGQEVYAYEQSLGLEDGLPSLNVSRIFQGSKGFIWIVTSDYGIHRYDGQRIKSFTKESHGLVSNFIRFVEEDKNGMFWIGASPLGEDLKGISILDPVTEEVQSVQDYLGADLLFDIGSIFRFQKNKDGSLWLLDKNYQVYDYDGEKLKIWGQTPKEMISFFKTQDNTLWGAYETYEKDRLLNKNFLLSINPKGDIVEKWEPLLQTTSSRGRVVLLGLSSDDAVIGYVTTKEAAFVVKKEIGKEPVYSKKYKKKSKKILIFIKTNCIFLIEQE